MIPIKPTAPPPRAPEIAIGASYVHALSRHFGGQSGQGLLPETSAKDPAQAMSLDALLHLVAMLNSNVGRHWPLDAASVWRSSMHGALEVAVRSSADVGAALAVIARYGRVNVPFAAVTLIKRKNEACLRIEPPAGTPPELWQPISEVLILAVIAMIAQFSEAPLPDAHIGFGGKKPGHADDLAAMFQLPVGYDQSNTQIRIGAAGLALASPYHDPEMHALMCQQLAEQERHIFGQTPMSQRVMKLLAASSAARPSAPDIAKRLGVSPRSLVRHLQAEGTSYRLLLDEHLKTRAIAMKASGTVSREDVAEALGYNDATSFSRAWRRWQGKSDS